MLHNLRQRYYSDLIYTYSGLFCVTINPYRKLPIYSAQVAMAYKGQRRTDMPPHVFAVADQAYRDMLQDRENQSILITGESGAGKTENTKKVIQYFATITSNSSEKNIEEQVIQCNPILEAFGNAKTIRNDNSSRFGKFIRVQFTNAGKIAGADIESYLLEKSRVIRQAEGERNYHIMYQLFAGAGAAKLQELLLDEPIDSYPFLSFGKQELTDVDDAAEFQATLHAMETLGFTADEQMDLFRVVAALLNFGKLAFSGRGEWAELHDTTYVGKVAHLLGLEVPALVKALTRPTIKINNEFTVQGRTAAQVTYSVEALCKATYERLFKWVVCRINKTLDTKSRKQNFIGVLDIAGFEIFKQNSFEQLCINYTNERLQQFFNHHMFILEQEEYKKENIDWEFVDFGLDLQPCIDLIEKKIGVLALLDEECLFPKATDRTFVDKVVANLDNMPCFGKPGLGKNRNGDFMIHHYAGTVTYTVDQWLDKNKDPLNDNVIELFTKAKNAFLAHIWTDRTINPAVAPDRRKKGTQFVTVSQIHREQLGNLMTTLRTTTPHFIRCIIPNDKKKPGALDAQMVLDQLRCNGVLEGIRICRKGFPSRIVFSEFRQRYSVLAPGAIPTGYVDGRKAAEMLVEALQLEKSQYRMGTSKVFFRAGVIGQLEQRRDEHLSTLLTGLQAYIRGHLARQRYKILQNQSVAVDIIQRNVRRYLNLRNWPWWKLFTKVKPHLNFARAEDEARERQALLDKAHEALQKEEARRKELEAQHEAATQQNQTLLRDLELEREAAHEAEERCTALNNRKAELEAEIQGLHAQLSDEEQTNLDLAAAKKRLEADAEELRDALEDVRAALERATADKAAKDASAAQLEGQLDELHEQVARLSKEKKAVEDKLRDATAQLQAEEDRANNLQRVKAKLETQVTDLEGSLEDAKSSIAALEADKRRLTTEQGVTNDELEGHRNKLADVQDQLTKAQAQGTQLQQRLDESDTERDNLQRQIRELQARVEELEDALSNERIARQKAEKQRDDLARQLEELEDRLEEAGGATKAHVELANSRETEINRLRTELDAQARDHEDYVSALRKKNNVQAEELQAQNDLLNKAKSKLEGEVNTLTTQLAELTEANTQLGQNKAEGDKTRRQLVEDLEVAKCAAAEHQKNASHFQLQAQRLEADNTKLTEAFEDMESRAGRLQKELASLQADHDAAQKELADERQARGELATQNKVLTEERDHLQEMLDEEEASRRDTAQQLAVARAKIAEYESDMTAQLEELEAAKRKLELQLQELTAQKDEFEVKNSVLTKTNQSLSQRLEDMTIELERSEAEAAAAEKKLRKHDQQVAALQAQIEECEKEIGVAQNEARELSTQVLNLRNTEADLQEQIAKLQRDNKHLQSEVDELTQQLGDGGKNVLELEQAKKRLEIEKDELTQTAEELETDLEAAERKAEQLQMAMNRMKQDHDTALSERDQQLEETRRSFGNQLDQLRETLDEESRSKADRVRQLKTLEGNLADAEAKNTALNAELAETQRQLKKISSQLRDREALDAEEQRLRDQQKDQIRALERRINDLLAEMDELRITAEQAVRSKKMLQSELNEVQDSLDSEMAEKQSLLEAKRKLELTFSELQEEIDVGEAERQLINEKVKRLEDQARNAESALKIEKAERDDVEAKMAALDKEVRALRQQLEDSGIGGASRRVVAQLEARVHELETELEVEIKSRGELFKQTRRQERKLKELQSSLDEEHKQLEKANDNQSKLQARIKSLRRQVEESEEQVQAAKTKARKLQREQEEAEERVASLENEVTRTKTIARASKVRAAVNNDTDDEDDDNLRPANNNNDDDLDDDVDA